MTPDISTHPCFNDEARHHYGRIHLPVAPRCNIQCNYCNRNHDCPNESRPGVTSTLLSPGQALYYLERVMASQPHISVVGIAGPGDPFATPELTLETLSLVRQRYPELLLCVATNGLALRASEIRKMTDLKVSHVTVTINAVDPEIARHIYAWVRDGRHLLRGLDAASLIIERQQAAVQALKARGVTVKVNTVVIPDLNEAHVADISRTVAALGADMQNCLSLYPVKDTPFQFMKPLTADQLSQLRQQAAVHLPQMAHCARCRADAVGMLGEGMPQSIKGCLDEAARQPLKPQEHRPYIAVASQEGVLVNLHLGESPHLWIYGLDETGEVKLIGMRPTPPAGGGAHRWQHLARLLGDCRAVLASGAGESPRTALERGGIRT